MIPFYSRDSLLRMVFNAIIGGYGLTFITIGVIILFIYVLQQLHLI